MAVGEVGTNGVHIVSAGANNQPVHRHAGGADEQGCHQSDPPLQRQLFHACSSSIKYPSHRCGCGRGHSPAPPANFFAERKCVPGWELLKLSTLLSQTPKKLLTDGRPVEQRGIPECRSPSRQGYRLTGGGGGAERVSKDSGPQWSTTSFWVNCRRVRPRMRASSSSK